MSFKEEAKEILANIDGETVTISISLIISIIKGLMEVLPKDITDEQLLALIKSYHSAGDDILDVMDQTIAEAE